MCDVLRVPEESAESKRRGRHAGRPGSFLQQHGIRPDAFAAGGLRSDGAFEKRGGEENRTRALVWDTRERHIGCSFPKGHCISSTAREISASRPGIQRKGKRK